MNDFDGLMQGDEVGLFQHCVCFMSLFLDIDQVLKRSQEFVGLVFVVSGRVDAVRL